MNKRWIQVVGTFDSETHTGEILGVQQARTPSETPAPDDDTLSLSVIDQQGQVLFEAPVEPDFGSCDDDLSQGTFQAFLEAPEAAQAIRLSYGGVEIHRLTPGAAAAEAPMAEAFGLGPQVDHNIPIVPMAPADSNATYTLQGREKSSEVWQTLDISLEQPSTAHVDLNQFPGARAIEVRVLKSAGFDTVEVDRADIEFDS